MESPEALRMLNMVTKNFYDESRIALWFFEALGREWDEMSSWSKDLHYEIFPQTCTWSIYIWEEMYGITPDDRLSLEVRRQQVMSKVLYRAPINPEAIRIVVQLLTEAEEVTVTDFVAPYTFEVIVTSQWQITNMVEVWEYIYKIKPSHLSFRLYFKLVTPVEHELHGGLHYSFYRETDMTEESGNVVSTIEITEADWISAQEDKEENTLG